MLRAEALKPAIEKGDGCEVAKVDFWDARADLNRLRILMFVITCVFALFLIGGIILVAIGDDTRGAAVVSFVATVASGGGMLFINARFKDAKKEKNGAEKLVHSYCDAPQRVVEELDNGAEPAAVESKPKAAV